MSTELHTNQFKLFLKEIYNFFDTINLDDYQNQPNRYSKPFKVELQFDNGNETIVHLGYAKLFFWRGIIDLHLFKNEKKIETNYDESLSKSNLLEVFNVKSDEKYPDDIVWFIDVNEFIIALIDLFKELDNYKTNQKLDIHNAISIMKFLSETD